MSNTIGYTLGCVTPVRYALTQGEDATGNVVSSSVLGCSPGCWNGDYRDRRYWAQIPSSAIAASGGTDYYGALAPTLKFQGGGTYRDICPTVCYCEGPVSEGETVTRYLGRYETRWMALLVEGLVYYGRVDGTLIQAPLTLFPDPLSDTATHIALSFDANARAVFAYEDDGTIYVRRYVAEVPTTYSWTGTNPCLFFNGVINSDDTQTDVVCYHLTASGGGLYACFQRENFGVANLVIEDPGFDLLMAVDRGRGALASFMVVELSGKRIFAAVYPPWPRYAFDTVGASLAFLGGGDYVFTAVATTGADSVSASLDLVNDGDYLQVTVTSGAVSDSVSGSLAFGPGGDYALVVVTSPGGSDSTSSSLDLLNDGDYKLAAILGGSYSDSTSPSVALLNDGDYSL